MLALIPPALEPIVIVLGPVLFGLLLILLPFVANKGERSFLRRPWAVGIVLVAVLMIGTFWVAGEQAPWSPDFTAQPLAPQVVGATSGPIYQGAQLFNTRGCQACHMISGSGGQRGPNLTTVGNRLTQEQLIVRILNGGHNMPAYSSTLPPDEVTALVAFLRSRQGPGPTPQTVENTSNR